MEYLIGGVLALLVAGFATRIGLDRSRAFYPTVLIVIASYYVLFAAMGAPVRVLWAEIAFASLVSLVATIGFRRNLWFVAAMLVGHGVFDFFHETLVVNPGVPRWWPGFCMTFDVVAGVWMALLLRARAEPAGKGNLGLVRRLADVEAREGASGSWGRGVRAPRVPRLSERLTAGPGTP